MAKRKKREYVVGYKGDCQCVYGPDYKKGTMFCDRMTLWSAKRRLAQLTSPDVDRVIYRLVPVFTAKGKRWR